MKIVAGIMTIACAVAGGLHLQKATRVDELEKIEIDNSSTNKTLDHILREINQWASPMRISTSEHGGIYSAKLPVAEAPSPVFIDVQFYPQTTAKSARFAWLQKPLSLR